MNIASHASEYASNGWYVFPVLDKQPLVKWRDESTNDTLEIARTDEWNRATGIGLDCGKSGIVVIDVDDVNAVPQLAEKLGWDPVEDDTLVAYTGGGGYHIFYKAGEQSVRNSASKVVPGIDVRGDGGYVVLPPSDHPSGTVYRWYRQPEVGVRPIPEKMVEILNYREQAPAPEPTPVSVREKWGMAVLAEEAAIIEACAPGTRNNTLFEHAGYVYDVVKGGHLDKAVADARLEAAASRVGLGSQETARTLDSAWATATPRHPAETAPPSRGSSPVSPAGEKKTFRVLGLDELEQLPPPQWLLPERLPEGQTWIYGPPGSGKTFIALDWAASVAASGLNVLYFVGEGVQGFARRVLAWKQSRQANLSTFKAIPQAPHLLDRESVETLAHTVEQYSPSLIVVDTFARASVGGDENSARDVGLAIDALDYIYREHGASSLVIHHSNKSGAGERGSSAIRGAADATWEVIPGIDGDYLLGFEVHCRKMKDAEPPKKMLMRLVPELDSAVIHPPTVVSPPAHLQLR